jgi:hypothetical protein
MSFTCRRGHYSASDDYCDVCGARNWSGGQGEAAVQPAYPVPAVAMRAEQPCPVCSTLREGSDRYCPNCAYDFETGEAWEARQPYPEPAELAPAPEPSSPVMGLVIVVGVDGSRSNERGCPPPPEDMAERIFIVDGPSMVIGREEAPGIHVPIPNDPYVSRRHAELIDLGGQWGVRDLQSTNGTRLNGVALTGTEVRLIGPDDVVEVGCFSRLTVRERSSQGVNQ